MTPKTKIIISDTHIGAGGVEEGNKLEDFISDAEFVDWLHDLVAESNRDGIDMELIINGDWIEFLQIPSTNPFQPHTHYDTNYYTDVAESAALKRLEIVYEWHPSIFLGLSDFLNAGTPRRTITILYGNHDPELAYPALQDRIRGMVNATGAYADLLKVGLRTYFQDGIYIEHGNAYVESLNRFTDPDHPFDPKQPDRIERPFGSNFVTYVFNKIEWQRPWIDGVHPLTSMVFYALAFEPDFALDILHAFLSLAPDILLNSGIAGDAGQGPTTGDQILTQIESTEQRQQLAQQLRSDPAFAASFTRDVQQALIEKGAAPPPTDGVAAIPGDVAPDVYAREITEMYWHLLEEAGDKIARQKGARVVLFGHIHEAIAKQLPSGATYLNTGTWVWKADFSEASDDLWQDLVRYPEKYMNQRLLTFARIDIDESGEITKAGLGHVGEAPEPPVGPGPQPQPSLWAKFVLFLRKLFDRLFG